MTIARQYTSSFCRRLARRFYHFKVKKYACNEETFSLNYYLSGDVNYIENKERREEEIFIHTLVKKRKKILIYLNKKHKTLHIIFLFYGIKPLHTSLSFLIYILMLFPYSISHIHTRHSYPFFLYIYIPHNTFSTSLHSTLSFLNAHTHAHTSSTLTHGISQHSTQVCL